MELDTLFFGGGTPSHLTPPQLSTLKRIVENRFVMAVNSEVTAECNPNDIDSQKIDALIGLGVNRISLGSQSMDKDKLKRLERDHSRDDVARAVAMAKDRGIASVSMDLIFAAPLETLDDWKVDLESALSLNPDHVSAYELTFEKGTQFWNRLRKGKLSMADEELRADMYQHAIDRLGAGGWQQYELSSFAKDGHQCQHNKSYWNGSEYLAFGPGASRFVGGQRSTNHQSPLAYMKRIEVGDSPVNDIEHLTGLAAARERLAVGLRLLQGVDVATLEAFSELPFEKILSTQIAEMLVQNGLLEFFGGRCRLTSKGIMVSDSIATSILNQLDNV